MIFFNVITRVCRRPFGLRRAVLSVKAQSCRDWEQFFIVDDSGKDHPGGNVLWANAQFYHHRERINSRYVVLLDDDGEMINDGFLEIVKRKAIAEDLPEAILIRSVSPKKGGGYHKLPSEEVWRLKWDMGERPAFWYGHGYNWVVRADVFKALVHYYIKPRGGDWYFTTSMIRAGVTFVKCNVIGMRSVSRGKGVVFEDAKPGWFRGAAKELGIKRYARGDWRLKVKR